MEDLYFLEIHILKVKFQCKEPLLCEDLNMTVYIDFGTIASFEIRQDEFKNDLLEDETLRILSEADKKKQAEIKLPCEQVLDPQDLAVWKADGLNRAEIDMSSGASLLFSQNPHGLKQSFELFPLEVSVWANIEAQQRECVGVATYNWDSKLLNSIDQAGMCCYTIEPTTVKVTEDLKSEVTGSKIGEILMLIRLSSLGKTCVTLFKETNKGAGFVFRNRTLNKSYKCKFYGIETTTDDIKPIGVLYETLEVRDPDDVEAAHRKSRVAKDLREAGLDEECIMFVTGDKRRSNAFSGCNIPFPCGNPECTLINMIKDYLRNPSCYEITDMIASNKVGDDDDGACCCGSQPENVPRFPLKITPCSCEPIPACCTAPCADPVDHSKCGQCTGCCGLNKKTDETELERLVYEGLTKMFFANKAKSKKCP